MALSSNGKHLRKLLYYSIMKDSPMQKGKAFMNEANQISKIVDKIKANLRIEIEHQVKRS